MADGAVEVPDIEKYVSAGSNGDGTTGTQLVLAKLLVSNSMAGSVIGKAGGNIEQLQRSSGARIQLSKTGEFYPGTSDRVLLLSGTLHAVLTAIFLILEKVSRDSLTAKPSNNKSKPPQGEVGDAIVKIALSRSLCGLLIGHKGQTVRDFITDSGSMIRVQSLAELAPSDPERTITISGARDQVLRAVALILNTLSMHDQYATYMESTLQLANSQGVLLPHRSSASSAILAPMKASLSLWLPDEDVGAILGRRGQNLVEIQQSARVAVKISDRAKMDPTLNEREIVVSGTLGAIKLAEAMITEKLHQHRSRSASQARQAGNNDESSAPEVIA